MLAGAPLQLKAAPLGFIETENALRRHSASFHWESLKSNSQLYAKDFVFSGENTRTQIRFKNDSALKLDPGTLIQISEPTVGGGFEAVVLNGRAETVVKGVVAKPRIISTFSEPVVLSTSLPLPLPEIGPEFVSPLKDLSERLKLRRSELEPLIKPRLGLKSFALEDFKLLLTSPKNRAKVAGKNVEFDWGAIPFDKITYVIELSRYSTFDAKIRFSTSKNHIRIIFKERGKYFWRVTASSRGTSIVSPTNYLDFYND
jgi:hypothetical protein